MNDLFAIGFEAIGEWRLAANGLVLHQHSMKGASPALYAFIVDDEVMYVGKTAKTLGKRLNQYRNPGVSQKTNRRINAEIRECLRKSKEVEILGWCDPAPSSVGPFSVDTAAGLEDDIIRQLQPAWNGGTRQSDVVAVARGKAAADNGGRAESAVFEADETNHSFMVAIGETYMRTGFFNVPVSAEEHFGVHNDRIEITGANLDEPIEARIDRNANPNHTPRIMGGVRLRDWFQGHVHLGWNIVVLIEDAKRINLVLLLAPGEGIGQKNILPK